MIELLLFIIGFILFVIMLLIGKFVFDFVTFGNNVNAVLKQFIKSKKGPNDD